MDQTRLRKIDTLTANQQRHIWTKIYYKYADGVFGLDMPTLRVLSDDAADIMSYLWRNGKHWN